MQTKFKSATDCFHRLVEAGKFDDVDACWAQFAAYLAKRVKARPAALIGCFHGAAGNELMVVIQRWLTNGPSSLLDPLSDDVDAPYFREFDQKTEVINEVEGFIKELGEGHLFN